MATSLDLEYRSAGPSAFRRQANGWFARALFGLLLSVANARALGALGLDWEKDVIEVSTSPEQTELRAEFPFRNRTGRTVTITAVATSCGCTTAALEKKTYRTGENGRVAAIFSVGDRTGLQEKTITVKTDVPGEDEPKELLLRINVVAYLAFAPHALFWKTAEPAVEKTITCTALLSSDITLADALSNNPAMIARIEVVEPGRKYLLHLRPQTTDRPLAATVRMTFKVAGAPPRSFYADGNVVPRDPNDD
jgi:Protein of unknown function (DUF1573)